MEPTFLSEVFPKEIMDYFEIKGHCHLCFRADKVECLLIDFDEKNEMPNGYSSTEYESKGFTNRRIVQDFSI